MNDTPHALSPHLTHEGTDHVTGHRHCVGCVKLIHTRHHHVEDHIATSWVHYRWKRTPEIIARHPETGHTLEGVVAVPARKILAPVPLYNYVVFCKACYKHPHLMGCGGCGKPVNLNDQHSVSEVLHKTASGHHHSFSKILWHAGCLPTALSAVDRPEKK